MSDFDKFTEASRQIIFALEKKILSFKEFETTMQKFNKPELTEDEKQSLADIISYYKHPWSEETHHGTPIFEKDDDELLLKNYVNIVQGIVEEKAYDYL